MNEAMRCKCPKPLKDGARCAKCGRSLPLKRRPRPPMLDPAVRKISEHEQAAWKDSSRAE